MQLIDFHTNLIPYPRIHFPLVSFSPIMPPSRIAYEALSAQELIKAAFREDHQMIKVDTKMGNYMACSLFLRGDVPPNDVNSAIGQLKASRDVRFVEYSPSGFKVCVSSSCSTDLIKFNKNKNLITTHYITSCKAKHIFGQFHQHTIFFPNLLRKLMTHAVY